MDSIDDTLDDYLSLDISKLVRCNDLSELSNCNVLFNEIVHDPKFLKCVLYSVHPEMEGHINKKKWNDALRNAAFIGDRELCEWFIELGATEFNWGLLGAAFIGDRELCEYFISLGVNIFNGALRNAAYGGHRELCEWIVSLGADDFDFDLALIVAIDGGGDKAVCEYLISCGATIFDEAYDRAIHNGNEELSEWFLIQEEMYELNN